MDNSNVALDAAASNAENRRTNLNRLRNVHNRLKDTIPSPAEEKEYREIAINLLSLTHKRLPLKQLKFYVCSYLMEDGPTETPMEFLLSAYLYSKQSMASSAMHWYQYKNNLPFGDLAVTEEMAKNFNDNCPDSIQRLIVFMCDMYDKKPSAFYQDNPCNWCKKKGVHHTTNCTKFYTIASRKEFLKDLCICGQDKHRCSGDHTRMKRCIYSNCVNSSGHPPWACVDPDRFAQFTLIMDKYILTWLGTQSYGIGDWKMIIQTLCEHKGLPVPHYLSNVV